MNAAPPGSHYASWLAITKQGAMSSLWTQQLLCLPQWTTHLTMRSEVSQYDIQCLNHVLSSLQWTYQWKGMAWVLNLGRAPSHCSNVLGLLDTWKSLASDFLLILYAKPVATLTICLVLYLLQNFIDLSIADGYIACGSETNEVLSCLSSLSIPTVMELFFLS
jgi:hypothetical protein